MRPMYMVREQGLTNLGVCIAGRVWLPICYTTPPSLHHNVCLDIWPPQLAGTFHERISYLSLAVPPVVNDKDHDCEVLPSLPAQMLLSRSAN